jgi:hypothetical protein
MTPSNHAKQTRKKKLHIGSIVKVKGLKTRGRVTYIRAKTSEDPEKYRVRFAHESRSTFFNRSSLRKLTKRSKR